MTVQDATEVLLRELESLGFRSKAVDHYRFEEKSGGAGWKRIDQEKGVITLYRDCTPGAVAHELAHGFHERLRYDQGLPDLFGEDYAEAIRWFVEERLGWTEWRNEFQTRTSKWDRVLRQCNFSWTTFVQNLKDGKFYPE